MLLSSLGGILFFVGTIWLIVTAVQTGKDSTDKIIWALVNFFCQPVGGIIFYIVKKQGMVPLILVIIGFIICGFGYYSLMSAALNQVH